MQRGLDSLRDLLIGDRTFEIPIYQRSYSWKEEHLEDFWNDLLYLDVGKKHYFGTIILRETGKSKGTALKDFKVFEIIDGQQRLATALILLKEVITQLGKTFEENAGAIDDLKKDYLKYDNIYKLELLGDDSEFFRDYILEDREYPDEILTPSQGRLRDAKSFFRGRLEKKAEELSQEYKGFLRGLKEKVDNLEIIRYDAEKVSDAVLIFETVNDRGRILSRLDKTKSFIMHMIYLSEPADPTGYLVRVNESFSNIFRYLESILNTEPGRDLGEEDIQRYHFVTYEAEGSRDVSRTYLKFLRKNIRDLYREEKKRCLEYSLEYASDLEGAFYALKEIVSYNASDEIGALLKKLFTLGRVASFYPLLIATWAKFKNEKEKIKEILRLIETFTFRVYSVGRSRADTGEGRAYRLAYKVHKEDLGFDEIVEELKRIIEYYGSNEEFQRDLKVENFYPRGSRWDIKYLLFEYEKFLREQAKEPLEIDLDSILSDRFEIEHIWPRHPEELPENLIETHDQYVNKLSNLTLASKSWNAQWGNRSFEIKKEKYQESSLRLQRKLSSFIEWGKEQIEDREQQIVKFAMERWKI